MHRTIRSFLIDAASKALAEQGADGAMPPGRNGPYGHTETPLRNTCHWLLTWCRVYEWTADIRFRDAADHALAYALRPSHRPHGANWMQRDARGRDRCNGVIGAAWVIEALVAAHRVLHSDKALAVAREVFELHPFDESRGLWKRVEIDGRILPFDGTLNHQLWFASAAACLAAEGCAAAETRFRLFMDKLDGLFAVKTSGLIRHRIRLHPWDRFVEPGSFLHKLYIRYDRRRTGTGKALDAQKRDIGYQAFNLHALAVLHVHVPNHAFWSGKSLAQALAYARGPAHAKAAGGGNPYAFPYNPVGFEMARILQEFFPLARDERRGWTRRQIVELTESGTRDYGAGADDPATARARICEAVELEDVDL